MKCNYFLVVTKKEYHNHDKTKESSPQDKTKERLHHDKTKKEHPVLGCSL